MNTSQVVMRQIRIRRGLVFGVIIVTALFAFELFNYSTTEFALSDLLGELDFAGIRWATILAIAFCGIDFAGIARLFTPVLDDSGGSDSNPNESWYLFGAWLLAATMNAMLTWWGISLAILGHQTLGNDVVSRATLLRVVPIFVSVLVWLIRVLIIGTFSVAGDRLFNPDAVQEEVRVLKHPRPQPQPRTFPEPAHSRAPALRPANSSSVVRSAGKSAASNQPEMFPSNRPEPTYHSISANSGNAARGNSGGGQHSTTPRPGAPRPGSQGSQYRNGR